MKNLKTQIQNSKALSDEEKKLILEDLQKMEEDHDYRQKLSVGFPPNRQEYYENAPAHEQINAYFIWDFSDLGGEFWANVVVKLTFEYEQGRSQNSN